MLKKEVVMAALEFLRAVAERAQSEIGANPTKLQQGMWWVKTGPTSSSGSSQERETFDAEALLSFYERESMRQGDFLQQSDLRDKMVSEGRSTSEVQYHFLQPLVNRWCELANPFDLNTAPIQQLVDEFAGAVIDGRTLVRSRDALLSVDLGSGPLVIEKGIGLRGVTGEELWEFGNEWIPDPQIDPLNMPSEDWVILDIELESRLEDNPRFDGQLQNVREALIACLVLCGLSDFKVLPLGTTINFGVNSAGRYFSGRPMPREFGRPMFRPTIVLDEAMGQKLKRWWPRVRDIMGSSRDHLRLPAQRLVDGLGRARPDDAIIDYAIGLESLLTEGVRDELRYRFSLRGATILAWEDGVRNEGFRQLRDFYDLRSKIIHGATVEAGALGSARIQGEASLRDIWWWYFEQGTPLSEATRKVDERILE